MAVVRALCVMVTDLFVTSESLVRSIATVSMAIAQLIHSNADAGRMAHAIGMHAFVRLIVDRSLLDRRAVKLVGFVDAIVSSIAMQFVWHTFETVTASKLVNSTDHHRGPVIVRVASAARIFAVLFVGLVEAVDDTITVVAETDAAGWKAERFILTTFVLTRLFIGMVTKKTFRMLI